MSNPRVDALREVGWRLAVQNDYMQNGKLHTFCLFTRGYLAVWGEGRTDDDAMAQVEERIVALELSLTGEARTQCPRCGVGTYFITKTETLKCLNDECGWHIEPKEQSG